MVSSTPLVTPRPAPKLARRPGRPTAASSVSFDRPEIGDEVVDGLVGVLVEQLVVDGQRIANVDLHAGHARERAVVARRIPQRDSEVVEAHEGPRDRRTRKRRYDDLDLLGA